MALGADRYASRADTLVFIGCVLLSVAAMGLPDRLRDPFARTLRQTVLAPLLALQQQTERLSAALERYDAVVAQRDSAALAATFLGELRSENLRLRGLLGLGPRLGSGYIPAEVLHQTEPTNALTFLVSAGRKQGVKPLSAVVSPEGLVGIVSSVDAQTSVVVSWAHPEFRASAMAADGSVYGIVAPHGTEGPRVGSDVPDRATAGCADTGGVRRGRPRPHTRGLPSRLGEGGVLRRKRVGERLPLLRGHVAPELGRRARVGQAQGNDARVGAARLVTAAERDHGGGGHAGALAVRAPPGHPAR